MGVRIGGPGIFWLQTRWRTKSEKTFRVPVDEGQHGHGHLLVHKFVCTQKWVHSSFISFSQDLESKPLLAHWGEFSSLKCFSSETFPMYQN